MSSRGVPVQLGLFDEPTPAGTDEPAALGSTAPAGPDPPPSGEASAPPWLPADGRRELARRLDELLGGRLRSLVLTDNRSRIVSSRPARDGQKLEVRIHRCFAGAPDATLRAVADFLLSRRSGRRRSEALRAIRGHFARHGPADAGARSGVSPAPGRAPRRLILRPVGRFFDLRELRDSVNREYFGGELEIHITWGRAVRRGPPLRRRRGRGFSVRLGSYDERCNVVRIHRCLDRPEVPRYVVESVVHHEMLHAALPPVVTNGRRRIHTPEFRRRERLFRHHEKAERWIGKNFERLAGAR